ncbi:hypothetical protein LEP1GSC077_0391 [Leptospira interrogans str. C10069]|nr:hypothetical protein LEP1GSC077_0391 [Leptospira interrogans str. C10069]
MYSISLFRELKKDSATALSQQFPFLLLLRLIPLAISSLRVSLEQKLEPRSEMKDQSFPRVS